MGHADGPGVGDERYAPFSRMLLDVSERYRRPMIVSEIDSEGHLALLAELRAHAPRLTAAGAEMLRRCAGSEVPTTEG